MIWQHLIWYQLSSHSSVKLFSKNVSFLMCKISDTRDCCLGIIQRIKITLSISSSISLHISSSSSSSSSSMGEIYFNFTAWHQQWCDKKKLKLIRDVNFHTFFCLNSLTSHMHSHHIQYWGVWLISYCCCWRHFTN